MTDDFAFAHVLAVGRVQGVGFREFARRVAEAHGVAGFVRNRGDGTVEARLVARAERLEAVLAHLRRGPPQAMVRELRILAQGPAAPETGFRVEATL